MVIDWFATNHPTREVCGSEYCYYCFIVCLLSFIILLPDSAFAYSDETGIACTMYKIKLQLEGPIGKGISIIVLFVMAIGVFTGKISLWLFLLNILAIGLIFKSDEIMIWLGDGVGFTCRQL